MRAISRRTLYVAAGMPLATALFLAAIYLGWRHEPPFYRTALEADKDAQIRASNALLEQASALINDVHKKGQWQALFTADQINGWLAIDVPKNHGSLFPAELVRPRVELNRGRIVVACQQGSGAFASVVSLTVEPYLTGPNELAIRIRSARSGWFPLPLQPILDQVSRGAADAGLPLRWEQAGGDPIAVVSLSTRRADGKMLSVESLDIQSGELYVAGTTRSGSWPSEGEPESEPVLQATLPEIDAPRER